MRSTCLAHLIILQHFSTFTCVLHASLISSSLNAPHRLHTFYTFHLSHPALASLFAHMRSTCPTHLILPFNFSTLTCVLHVPLILSF
jgi:hypothetical protein